MHEVCLLQIKHGLVMPKFWIVPMATNQTTTTYQNSVTPLDWSCQFFGGQVWARTKQTLYLHFPPLSYVLVRFRGSHQSPTYSSF